MGRQETRETTALIFYCRDHPSFEGLDMGKLHDHIEKSHLEIAQGRGYKQAIAEYFREKVEVADFRRTDGHWIARTWGRPPSLAGQLGQNEIEK